MKHTTYSDPLIHHMDLEVEMRSDGIHVGGGVVRYAGNDYPLDDALVTIPTRAHPTVVFGYLVRVKESGDLALFVDEHIQDGLDESYVFEREGPYELFAYLFRVTVPSGVKDLSTLDFDHWRIIPKE